MSSRPVPLKTRRIGEQCTLNLSRAQTFFRWCGLVARRGGASSVTRTTPELAPLLLAHTPHQWKNVGFSTHITCIGTFFTVGLRRYKARTHDIPATSPCPLPLGYHGPNNLQLNQPIFVIRLTLTV
ncbi:hypothetical protein TNCV_3335731 [Trichonephila clavipes]|nr:hypothetical protein TNCV_3335731 [Trichonephila clavipes]